MQTPLQCTTVLTWKHSQFQEASLGIHPPPGQVFARRSLFTVQYTVFSSEYMHLVLWHLLSTSLYAGLQQISHLYNMFGSQLQSFHSKAFSHQRQPVLSNGTRFYASTFTSSVSTATSM